MTFLLIHALQQLGAVTLFLNNRVTKKEISFQLANAEVKHVIVAESLVDKVATGISYATLAETEYEAPALLETCDLSRAASVM
ncbi:2-succinylbenzoate-CoA ligase, partial [Listeria monocytogenes]|nr:2-succinylbenzoate-CoA ligase [Listeria monocytogenes]